MAHRPCRRQGPGKKPPTPVARAGDVVNQETLLARPVCNGATEMHKSAVEKDKELKAQPGSSTAGAKALEKAKEATGILRELGIENDAILKDLGFRRPT
jgi:hypothetical protein